MLLTVIQTAQPRSNEQMPETLTINGARFEVPDAVLYRYDGFLTPEAPEGLRNTIHQTIMENLRNNFAKKVKDALNGSEELPPEKHAELASEFSAYAEKYEFGVRGAAAPKRDPLEREMFRLAKDDLSAKYSAKYGQKPDKEWLESTVPIFVEKYNDQLTKRARAVLRAKQASTETGDDFQI
jgi:hypothetical protein